MIDLEFFRTADDGLLRYALIEYGCPDATANVLVENRAQPLGMARCAEWLCVQVWVQAND